MQRRGAALRLLLALVCSITLIACGGSGGPPPMPNPTPLVGWSAPVRAVRETMLQVPDGPLVTIPAGAVVGDGVLTVSVLTPEVTRVVSGGAKGWAIEVADTALAGRVRLAFPVPDEEPDPLVGYTDATGRLVPVRGQREGNLYVVETDHFSNWFSQAWDRLLQKARVGLDKLYSAAAEGKAPSCQGEDKVRGSGVTVTSDDGNRVLWCLGADPKGAARLKMTNARGYAVTAEYTPGMTLVERPSLLAWMPSLSQILDRPSKKENKLTLVASGETVEFTLAGTPQHQGVMVQPSVPAYLASAAWYSVETVTSLNSWIGGKATKIQQRIDLALCAKDFVAGRETVPGNAWEAQKYLNEGLRLAFGCVQEQLKEDTAGDWVLGRVIDVLSWLWSGIQTALNGFGAALDTALDPSGYRVVVDVGEAKPAVPSAATLVRAGVCGAGGKVTGHTFFTHPTWGKSVFVTCLDLVNRELQGLAVIDNAGGIRWSYHIHGNYYVLGTPSPGFDASGNLFVTYDPGRYMSVAVFRPVEGSLKRLAGFYSYDDSDGEDGRFYYSELVGPGGPELYSIRLFRNDCVPSCASGTTTSQLYVWNGTDYAKK